MFIVSLMVGSFLNVAIYRIPENQSLANPPSHCPNCNYRLAWFDLIPVLSFLLLGGKCRKCKQKISLRYPLVELSTALLAGLIYVTNGLNITTFAYVILIYFLVVVTMIDFDKMEVYTVVTKLGTLIGLIYLIYTTVLSKEILLGFGVLIVPLVLMIISKLTQGAALGDGDADIMLMASVFIGLKLSVLAIFIAFVFGGIVAAFLILKAGKNGKYAMPFGPFIALGSIISMAFGPMIIHYYLSLLV